MLRLPARVARFTAASLLTLAGLGCSAAELAGMPEPWLSKSDIAKAMTEPPHPLDAEIESNKPLDLIRAYLSETDADQRRELRNRYLVSSMLLIDAEFDRFVIRNGAIRKAGDTGAQSAAAILATTSAAFSPELTKTVLSLLSGAIIATNSAINKNYFYEQTFPMLLKQMQADRSEALVAILRNHLKSDKDYPLFAANTDLRKLYEAGTFEAAFTKLDQAASQNKTKADTNAKNFSTANPALSIQRWLQSEPIAGKTDTLDAAIKVVDDKGFQQAGSPLVWVFKASDAQLQAVAAKVQAPSISEAEDLATRTKSEKTVNSLQSRRDRARNEVIKLITEQKLPEARALVVQRILDVNRSKPRPQDVMDPIVNASEYVRSNDPTFRRLHRGENVAPLIKWAQETATPEQLPELMSKLVIFE